MSTRPPDHPTGPAPRASARPRLRTYVLLAIGASAGITEFARPLGTLAATTRGLARAAACVIHADVAPGDLRVVAAGSVSVALLTRALAMDGQQMLAA